MVKKALNYGWQDYTDWEEIWSEQAHPDKAATPILSAV
jgi:hypothetical protein